jgi:putative methyltransferase (TIGR04325 family)
MNPATRGDGQRLIGVRDFIPPIVARRLFAPAPTPKRYATYRDALRHCPEQGYGNSDIARVVLEKTTRFRDALQKRSDRGVLLSTPSDLSVGMLYRLATVAPDIRVLDFGGACGTHYFIARALLPPSCRLRWVVVETPTMVEAASELTDQELSFSSGVQDAAATLKSVDLVYSSGALQYLKQPDVGLRALVSVGAPHILFNRLALTKGDHDVIVVQQSPLSWHGPGEFPTIGIRNRMVDCPMTFLKESSFFGILREHYEVVATFPDASGVLPITGEPIVGMGVLACRKA